MRGKNERDSIKANLSDALSFDKSIAGQANQRDIIIETGVAKTAIRMHTKYV